MARPKIDLPPAGAIRALADDAGRIGVRVTPGARRESLEIIDGKLLARVRAKPENGKANAAVIALFAAALDMAPSRVVLVRGETSREKLFAIDNIKVH